MATLQRSTVSFRREGSSGLVWDDKCFSQDLYQMLHDQQGKSEYRELRPCQSTAGIGTAKRIVDSSAIPANCPRSLSSMTVNSLPSEGRFLKKFGGVFGKQMRGS